MFAGHESKNTLNKLSAPLICFELSLNGARHPQHMQTPSLRSYSFSLFLALLYCLAYLLHKSLWESSLLDIILCDLRNSNSVAICLFCIKIFLNTSHSRTLNVYVSILKPPMTFQTKYKFLCPSILLT